MKVSILGTNGLLADSIGQYCENLNCELHVYGLNEPRRHSYTSFCRVNLLDNHFDYALLLDSDVIIYAIGAGVQSNLKESADLIYHLNVMLPVNFCTSLRTLNYQGAFVTFGSYFEIGANANRKLFKEIDLLNSQLEVPNDYAISKRMLSRYLSSFKASFKNWHFILPTIYGENESSHRLIPYTLSSIVQHAQLNFTSGEQIRQYIYIDEIPLIIFKALSIGLESGIFNISGAETLSVKELVLLLFHLMNVEPSMDMFGTTQRVDVNMKVLELDGTKLYNKLHINPSIRISDVYAKYNYK